MVSNLSATARIRSPGGRPAARPISANSSGVKFLALGKASLPSASTLKTIPLAPKFSTM